MTVITITKLSNTPAIILKIFYVPPYVKIHATEPSIVIDPRIITKYVINVGKSCVIAKYRADKPKATKKLRITVSNDLKNKSLLYNFDWLNIIFLSDSYSGKQK